MVTVVGLFAGTVGGDTSLSIKRAASAVDVEMRREDVSTVCRHQHCIHCGLFLETEER